MMRERSRLLRPHLAWGIVLGGALAASSATASDSPSPEGTQVAPPPAASASSAVDPSTPVEVKVERVRPHKERHATLRFLRENRDFLRGRYDLLKSKPIEARGDAGEIDPRFLAYRQMLADIFASRDSVRTSEAERQRRELLASVTQLGNLEAQLDLLERLLADQRTRLGVLQEDFIGDQLTSLMVVVSGDPGQAAPSEIGITLDDGAELAVPVTAEQRESLKRGGVIQIFHGFVEPREQVVEVTLRGDSWPNAESGFVRLDFVRDELTLLRLDLSTLDAARGAPSIHASTWRHDARVHSDG